MYLKTFMIKSLQKVQIYLNIKQMLIFKKGKLHDRN